MLVLLDDGNIPRDEASLLVELEYLLLDLGEEVGAQDLHSLNLVGVAFKGIEHLVW